MNYDNNSGFYQRPFYNGQPPYFNTPNQPPCPYPFSPPLMRMQRRDGFVRTPISNFRPPNPVLEEFLPNRYRQNRSHPGPQELQNNSNVFQRRDNRRMPYMPIDLSKPWVTESIRSEYAKKEELLRKAKETKQQVDWESFKEQRNKCTKMYLDSEKEFLNQQNPGNMHSNFGGNATQHSTNGSHFPDNPPQTLTFACDTCDRSFPSELAFSKHMSEHRVCGVDGCTLSAHEKIIEQHILMQHSKGLYEKMKDLNNPENDLKWREERKTKYPRKETQEKKEKLQEEMWKKGIRIGERKNKFGKDKTRLVRKDPETWRKERETALKKKQEKRERIIQKMQPKLMIDEKADWNNGLPPFQGTKRLFEDEESDGFKISDDEDETRQPTKIKELVKVNCSLGALMAYGSDCSEDENEEVAKNDTLPQKDICEAKPVNKDDEQINETISPQKNKPTNPIQEITEINSEDEAPLEVKFEKTTAPTEIIKEEEKGSTSKGKRKRKNKMKNANQEQAKERKKFPYEFKTRKISQLERILDEDIRRERNIILQCVRYTVQNNFFS